MSRHCFEKQRHITPREIVQLLSAVLVLLSAGGTNAQTALTPNPQAGPAALRQVEGQKGPDRPAARTRLVPQSVVNKAIQRTLALPAFSLDLINELKRQDAAEGRSQRVRLGIGRLFDHPIQVSQENAGEWTTTPDGTHVYAIQITSTGALAIRLHLENVKLPTGARLLMYDPANPNPEAIPVSTHEVAPEGDIWMPTVPAETVVLECELPPGVEVSVASFLATGLSHFYRPLFQPRPKVSCESDVTCYPEWANQAAGVAEIIFVEGADTFQCTGSLVNDSDPATFINYFLTAHHCIGSQKVAATIDFYWFYESIACNNPNYNQVQTTGGADLLATSSKSDFAFMRLRQDPPSGVYYLGWSMDAPSAIETLTAIHHPMGDPKKISFGNLAGVLPNFWEVQWFSGVTEEGSSGSPLLNANKLIIGQLYGGASACDNTSGIDEYGRFDITFQTISQWLSPSGTYNGLFAESGQVALESSGFVNIRLKSSGVFSGTVSLAGKRSGFSGRFGSDGTSTNMVTRRGDSSLTITLTLEVSTGANRITGTITDGSWIADLTAIRAAFNRRTNPAPLQGSYTIVFPGQNSDPSLPAGNSYGTVKIDASGNVRLVASLADHATFSQSVPISNNGDWPLYAAQAAGKEQVWSWLVFDTNQPGTDVSGPVSWIKKPQATAKFYGAGFTNEFTAIGSVYQKPTDSTMRVINLASATVSFSGGDLPSDFSDPMTIATNNKVTNESTNRLSLSFAPVTGLFHGTVMPPGLTRSYSFGGAVLQKQNAGYGFLLGTNQTSSAVIGP